LYVRYFPKPQLNNLFNRKNKIIIMDPYLAEIRLFGGTFAPRQWMLCQGQLLPISEYDALFALLGTTYGGDGQTTFGLPDLRGRRAVHAGQGPGLSNYYLGEMSGKEQVTITPSTMPIHGHPIIGDISVTMGVFGSSGDPDSATPKNSYFATADENIYGTPADSPFGAPQVTTGFAGMSLAVTGGSQPIDIVSPYQALNFIICVEGIFPSRN
jgi:microcystin-dependent protein